MGNVNMEAYQVHYEGKSVAEKLKELDAIAQQIEDLPTFTSNDRVFLEAVPEMPTEEGKKVLTATTDDHGDTELTYETPEVESEDIAPAFSEETEYSEGDLVYNDGILYKFTADHTAGSWDPSEVTQTTVAAEFNDLKNTLTSATPRTATGTTAAQLTLALAALTAEQRARCSIAINGNDIILRQVQTTTQFDAVSVTTSGVKMYRYNTTLSTFYEFIWTTSITSQEIPVTSWTLYYHGTPIS